MIADHDTPATAGIAVLPADIAAKIAAGEVVERPASIVRELIDNALDAGARRIVVEIEAGGTRLIRVVDDGHGIPATQLPAAFLRHATSKLRYAEDLGRIATLGFRGEALPSIAAAADVDLASRPEGSPAGARISFRDGSQARLAPYSGAFGTVVEVRDLFARQPARQKFLRSSSSEAAQIATLAGLYAIAYPEVAFSLTIDGRGSLRPTGSGDRREALARLYGATTAAAMLELSPPGPEAAGCSVSGFISPPELTRANRSFITFFVNRRIVQSRRLAYAVESAYESTLLSGRHPIVVLDLRLPPADLDVNVHPTKSEVRFLNERDVHAAAYHSIRDRLALLSKAAGAASQPSSVFRPMTVEPNGAPSTPLPLWTAIQAAGTSERSQPSPPEPSARPQLPILRVVGQAGGLYIVAEGPDGMYLVDQHAAHERVLYEKLMLQRREQTIELQGLLNPCAVELSAGQEAVLVAHEDPLRELGFHLEPFGPQTRLLRAIPNVLSGRDASRLLLDLLDDLADGTLPADRDSRALMTVACHASVRAGKSLSMEEMRELLALLERCDLPRTCPHGRPTMLHLSSEALEREFRRR
jgi:DNA mismatch repair protein MutL